MFLHVSVILSIVGEYLGRYPFRDQVPTWDQVHPPGTRYTPRDQVHPLGPGSPGTRYSLGTGTPLGTKYTPRDQVHPPWDQVHPPGSEQCMSGDTGNKWAVRIPLECILVSTYI